MLPIAKVPEGVKFKPGDENAYAGKADFYLLKYGKYIIGMNCTTDKSFDMNVPKAKKVVDLTDGRKQVKDSVLPIAPRTTTVL